MASALQRASAIMASGTMVSRILGFVKAILLTFAIGGVISQSADAFANGNQLPNTIYMLLAGGMLNAVLVPQIVKAAQNPDGGKSYINKILTLVSVALFIITVIMMVLAPALIWLLASDWPPEQQALAVGFSYWCIPQIMFYGWYTVLGEVLNAKKIFGPFTWSPALANVIGIIGLVAFIVLFGSDPNGNREVTEWGPASIALLAGSATLGVAAQALILLVPWRKAGLSFKPDFKWRGVGLAQTGRIAGWGLATVVVMNLGGFITTRIVNSASGDGPSFQAMQTAWLVFMLPHSVIAVSLATAYFTQLAEFGQAGKREEFRESFGAASRQVLVLMLFAGIAFFMAARYVAFVMLPGADPEQVAMFVQVLQAYSFGLTAYSMMFIVQRAFYALSDARTPFFFMSAQIVMLVILTIAAGVFVDKSILGATYALIWSVLTVAQAVLAFWMLRRRIGRFGGTHLLAIGVRALIAAVPAAIVGYFVMMFCNSLAPEQSGWLSSGLSIVFALVVTAAMGVIYVGVLAALKVPEAKSIVSKVTRR